MSDILSLRNATSPMTDATPMAPVPAYKLFDANAVTLATLFGGPLAGTSLMALNYRRLGEKTNALKTVMAGIGATALLMLLGSFLPQGSSLPIGIGLLAGTRRAAQSLQAQAIGEHINQGGRLGSMWKAFGVGMAFLTALCGLIFLVMLALN